jgi:hypothetical protein
MFGKKICRQCGTSIKDKYDFCPYCGNRLEDKKEDFGMLGKDDFFNGNNFNEFKLPAGFNLILNSVMKNFEKQFKEIEKNQNQGFRTSDDMLRKPEEKKHLNINISIGKPIPMKINSSGTAGMPLQSPKETRKRSFDDLSPEKLKRFSRLPKEEPKTNIRRLSNKVFYEIDLPGVKSAKDISLLNLEKGVDLKSIPISLPILKYKLSKGKLVLEMDAHEN